MAADIKRGYYRQRRVYAFDLQGGGKGVFKSEAREEEGGGRGVHVYMDVCRLKSLLVADTC